MDQKKKWVKGVLIAKPVSLGTHGSVQVLKDAVQPWSRARSVQFCEYYSLIIWLNTLWRKRIKSLWIEGHCVLNERCMERKRILLCVIFKALEHFMMCICGLRYESVAGNATLSSQKRFLQGGKGKGSRTGRLLNMDLTAMPSFFS